jgi:uncharacterized protein
MAAIGHHSSMTRIVGLDVPCPACGQTVHITQIQSISYQGRDSDFRPVGARDHATGMLLETCKACGFSGLEEDFEKPVSAEVAALIRDRVTARATAARSGSPIHWKHAAMIAEWRGEPDHSVGYRYLHGAWALRDRGPSALARLAEWEDFFLRSAGQRFERALKSGDELPDRPRLTYLVGELCRRLGETEIAHRWFDRAIALAAADPEQARLTRLAGRQKTEPSDTLA